MKPKKDVAFLKNRTNFFYRKVKNKMRFEQVVYNFKGESK